MLPEDSLSAIPSSCHKGLHLEHSPPLHRLFQAMAPQLQGSEDPHAISLFVSGSHHALNYNGSFLSPHFSLQPLSR